MISLEKLTEEEEEEEEEEKQQLNNNNNNNNKNKNKKNKKNNTRLGYFSIRWKSNPPACVHFFRNLTP